MLTVMLAGFVSSSLSAQTLIVDMGGDRTICRGSSVDISPMVSGGIPPYVFQWSTGATTPSITVSPLVTTVYSVTVTDNGGNQGVSVSGSVTVNVETPYQMNCNDHIQVSLDELCYAELEPDMLLEGALSITGGYTINVYTVPGRNAHGNAFGAGDIGETFDFEVFNPCGNSCWGKVTIEDKLPPQLECQHDTLRCNDLLTPEERGFPIPPDAVIVQKIGDYKYLVSDWDACTDVELSYQDSLAKFACGNEFTKVLYRRWVALDASGNIDICYDTFSVYQPNIELDVNFPPSYDGHEEDPISCLDIQGYPTPDITGRPLMESCMTLQATYQDTKIDVCGATYKVLRRWTILDWCSNTLIERYQIIKVVDEDPPIVVCPPNFTISTDVYECTGATYLPEPTVLQECSDWDYEVFYKLADPNGQPTQNGAIPATRTPDGRYYVEDLPLGRTWLIYVITDDCGNYIECASEVDVEDQIPPIPVCDEHTTVSLTLDGTGKIFAETFSDKSYDNCGIDYFEVRRMDTACINPTYNFGPHVFFCCEDIGEEHMVVFRVWDLAGNSNTCMVEVTVQDKIPPSVVCPPDLTITCRFDFDVDKLDVFGKVVTHIADRDSIFADPYYYPNNGYAGLDGYAIDACDLEVIEEDSLDIECGSGTIYREFIATDPYGNTNSCTQRIFLRDPTPFSRRDITWPRNVTIDGCLNLDTKPARTGSPIYRNENCAQVAASYKDLVLTVIDSACYKIIRTWTVLDWCQYDPADNVGIWSYEQIIKVQNSQAPVLEICDDQVYCDDQATEINGVCYGYADLIQEATDDCTPFDQLSWRFRIDIFNDGSWDTIGFTNDARDHYPIGTHKIQWFVSDQCDNESSCTFLFEVSDCKPPTPYCLHGITTVVMPSTGCIDIWASDFDAGSYDNCTDTLDLKFSFSADTAEISRRYCCDSMISGNILTRPIRIYVTDEFGNQDYCETYIIIRDNDDVCPDSLVGAIKIAGNIENRADNEGVKNVRVDVNEMSIGLQMKSANTLGDGSFTVDQLPMHMDYTVVPDKNDDLLFGVTTADLVLIQRHILYVRPFTDPLDLLAADINKSGHVSAKDLTDLRKAILGLSTQFPNNKSWRFIPKGYNFADPAKPWNCEEDIKLYQVENDQWAKNFVGLKVGDVNKSAKGAANGALVTRTSGPAFPLDVADHEFNRGDRIEIPVMAGTDGELAAVQMTLVLNSDKLKLEQIIPGTLPVTPDHMGLKWLADGTVTLAWSESEALSTREGETLFTIVAYAQSEGRVNGQLHVSSSITPALAVDGELSERPLELRIKSGNNRVNDGYYLHQNRPNPFEGQTAISFDLPESATVTLTVFDVTGKVLFRAQRELNAGTHTEWIDSGMLNGAGIYYYQLDAEAYTATRKMILVE